MFFVLIHDYTLCFTGSPCFNFSSYNYISIRPYYIVIHLTMFGPISVGWHQSNPCWWCVLHFCLAISMDDIKFSWPIKITVMWCVNINTSQQFWQPNQITIQYYTTTWHLVMRPTEELHLWHLSVKAYRRAPPDIWPLTPTKELHPISGSWHLQKSYTQYLAFDTSNIWFSRLTLEFHPIHLVLKAYRRAPSQTSGSQALWYDSHKMHQT